MRSVLNQHSGRKDRVRGGLNDIIQALGRNHLELVAMNPHHSKWDSQLLIGPAGLAKQPKLHMNGASGPTSTNWDRKQVPSRSPVTTGHTPSVAWTSAVSHTGERGGGRSERQRRQESTILMTKKQDKKIDGANEPQATGKRSKQELMADQHKHNKST